MIVSKYENGLEINQFSIKNGWCVGMLYTKKYKINKSDEYKLKEIDESEITSTSSNQPPTSSFITAPKPIIISKFIKDFLKLNQIFILNKTF